MILKSLILQNFRSYSKSEFTFSPEANLIVGPNASGKTNLLEGIYFLATGKSFRVKGTEKETISYGQKVGRVEGTVIDLNGIKKKMEIILTTGELEGEKVAKKKYLINGVSKRALDFVGNFLAVYFGPEDLEIVADSPATRRDYLDLVLEQVDREYRRASLSYKKGLRQRNKLLEQIRDEGKPRSSLFFWDKLLVANGDIITRKRGEFIEFVNNQPSYFGQLRLVYDKSVISPQRLEQYAEEEVAAGMTLVGPHRDEVKFEMGEERRDLSAFGSRGEQRLAVFCLKLAELEFLAKKTGERPVLLLDDIFSELDKERRDQLLRVIPKQQTIITATELDFVTEEERGKMEVIRIMVQD